MKSIEHKLVFSGGAGQRLPLVNPMSSIQFSMLNCIQPCSNVNFNKTFLACFVYTPLLIKKKKKKKRENSPRDPCPKPSPQFKSVLFLLSRSCLPVQTPAAGQCRCLGVSITPSSQPGRSVIRCGWLPAQI